MQRHRIVPKWSFTVEWVRDKRPLSIRNGIFVLNKFICDKTQSSYVRQQLARTKNKTKINKNVAQNRIQSCFTIDNGSKAQNKKRPREEYTEYRDWPANLYLNDYWTCRDDFIMSVSSETLERNRNLCSSYKKEEEENVSAVNGTNNGPA